MFWNKKNPRAEAQKGDDTGQIQRSLTSLVGQRMAPRSLVRQNTEKGPRDLEVRRSWTAGLVSRTPLQDGEREARESLECAWHPVGVRDALRKKDREGERGLEPRRQMARAIPRLKSFLHPSHVYFFSMFYVPGTDLSLRIQL